MFGEKPYFLGVFVSLLVFAAAVFLGVGVQEKMGSVILGRSVFLIIYLLAVPGLIYFWSGKLRQDYTSEILVGYLGLAVPVAFLSLVNLLF